MITAHLPSGYVLGRSTGQRQWLLVAAMVGAVFPDIDLIWFYLIDNRAYHHHRYWVHAPGFWLLVAIVTLPLLRLYLPKLSAVMAIFLAAIGVHLVLDSIAGDIMWLWPFDKTLFHLVSVPAAYDNYILNFILHPVFLLELVIWGTAAVLWVWAR